MIEAIVFIVAVFFALVMGGRNRELRKQRDQARRERDAARAERNKAFGHMGAMVAPAGARILAGAKEERELADTQPIPELHLSERDLLELGDRAAEYIAAQNGESAQ